jgi:hypothetical protein
MYWWTISEVQAGFSLSSSIVRDIRENDRLPEIRESDYVSIQMGEDQAR